MANTEYDNTVKNIRISRGNPRGSGRYTKLTYDIMNKIVILVKAGNYIETAAAACGLSKQTLYNWLKRGNKVDKNSPKTEWIYAHFTDALMEALALAEARDLRVLDKAAANGAWQASAWRLERRNPSKWGRVRLDSNDDMYDQLNTDNNNDPIIKAIDNLYGAIGGDEDDGLNDGDGEE